MYILNNNSVDIMYVYFQVKHYVPSPDLAAYRIEKVSEKMLHYTVRKFAV